DGSEGDRQGLDVDVANDLVDLAEDLFAANSPQAEADIDQSQHVEVGQAFGPCLVLGQLAGSVDATDYRTHRTAGDASDLIAAGFQFFDYTHVRVAACATRAQYQGHSLTHRHLLEFGAQG